ncbi:MAG: outer membrane lipoprotein carrier protein LolA [Prevotella sp.]|nr:outer membrane lipoprotein carrier protein LolA [Prevotella sp.]MBR6190435.1 outer membrane lipoprotein carrier protein LolA [Prevotella sp.]
MKRLFFILAILFVQIGIFAQGSDFQRAVSHFKGHTATAAATRITHKAALAKDATAQGTLTMKQPATVEISIDGGKDALLMEGSTFTMTVKGKKHTTTSQQNPQFATFQKVFESILAGGSQDIAALKEVTVKKDGKQLVLTITPEAADKKQQRRMMFTSFVLTIDVATSKLLSLRMNEKAGNYTEYTFTNFQFK